MSNAAFIKKIAALVQKYAPQYGILVCSPIIAQAILESASGESELARNACNYFGLKWRKGRCPSASGHYIKKGSEQNADGTYTSSVMKWFKFPDMEAGVRGYFDFINIANYASLKGVRDPETYLRNIKAAGYATSLKYVENLLKVIEKYDLTKYDPASGEVAEGAKMVKVFLSAGHGGSDPGAVAYGLKEKDINLQTLLACREVLKAHGINVVCSRTTDENDPVAQEVQEANASGADLAVSFHANAGGGDGFEALCNFANADAMNLARLAEKHIKAMGQNSRGIKSGMRLKFIKATKMTSVLFESFFVDNDADNNAGDTLAEQRAFGVAYAKAILEHLGIEYNAAGTSAGAAQSNEKPGADKKPGAAAKVPYLVKITASALNVRAGAGIAHKINTVIHKGEVYTIVEEKSGWGKLKSGAGWICLQYAKKC